MLYIAVPVSVPVSIRLHKPHLTLFITFINLQLILIVTTTASRNLGWDECLQIAKHDCQVSFFLDETIWRGFD